MPSQMQFAPQSQHDMAQWSMQQQQSHYQHAGMGLQAFEAGQTQQPFAPHGLDPQQELALWSDMAGLPANTALTPVVPSIIRATYSPNKQSTWFNHSC
jgi:hypothetical protein